MSLRRVMADLSTPCNFAAVAGEIKPPPDFAHASKKASLNAILLVTVCCLEILPKDTLRKEKFKFF